VILLLGVVKAVEVIVPVVVVVVVVGLSVG